MNPLNLLVSSHFLQDQRPAYMQLNENRLKMNTRKTFDDGRSLKITGKENNKRNKTIKITCIINWLSKRLLTIFCICFIYKYRNRILY